MAEILSPGVFIEEVPSQAQVVQPVSTSTMGIVGGAERGPTDTATLVTSFEQYSRIFGELIRDSRMPLSMAAYYANGGRRAYVVRVAPADAISATASLDSVQDHNVFAGDGATAALTSAAGTALNFPSDPSTITFKWRAAGTPVVGEVLRDRDNLADLVGDAAQLAFEGRINPLTSLTAQTGLPYLPLVDPDAGTFTVDCGGPFSIVLTAAVGASVATGTNGAGSTATLDLMTGRISMLWDGAETPTAADITMSYTPTIEETGTDDGLGALTGDLTAGTVAYATGVWGFTTTTAPINNYDVVVTYEADAWDLLPISEGAWGNGMQMEVSGNADFYTLATDTYSKFNVLVRLLNSSTGNYDIVESFEEIDFVDSTSAQYFPDVINDLSDLLRVTEPANVAEAPQSLNGTAYSVVLAGGDETTPGRNVTGNVLAGTTPRTVTISWTESTVAKTATDDGAGNLTGDVDGAGTNTIDYTTGAVDFTSVGDIDGGTLVTAVGAVASSNSSVITTFGAVAEGHTAGADGTYDSTNYGRNQFTVSSLQVTSSGLYALNRVEELLQVVLPDFAGDVQLTTDLLDYVDSRAVLPQGGDRFAILAVPQGSSAQEAVDYFRFELQKFSKFAALYWPWVKVADPLRDNRPTVFPPMAHIAGIYARVDQTRNVGKSPGGTLDGALKYVTGLEVETTQGERDTVYPNKINPLIASAQTGIAVWGVRTISNDSEWRYINARRLFMFVERSVYNSTFWIVFENNGPTLWARIKAQVEGFLLNLFNEGMFAGSTPAQAFFVTCDETNNSESSINAGQVIIDVGIAPNKPAEFVRFRFQQKTLNS